MQPLTPALHLVKKLKFYMQVPNRTLLSRDKRKAREYRGGLLGYERAKKDIRAWLKEDKHTECRFTTMFDLYALPDDFPGYAEAMSTSDPYDRVGILEQKMAEDIGDSRFIPYIQLHEFEALILADPKIAENNQKYVKDIGIDKFDIVLKEKQASFDTTINGVEYQVDSFHSPKTDWIVAVLIEKSELSEISGRFLFLCPKDIGL